MEVKDILIFLSGCGLIYLYAANKKSRLQAQREIMNQKAAEANEIHKAAQELRDGKLKTDKEEYEKAKLKVFAVIDGDKPDSEPDDGKS